MVKNGLANAGNVRDGFDPWVRKISWRKAWQPTPVFLLEESHGQRSLVGYSPQMAKSDTLLSDFHFTFGIHVIILSLLTSSGLMLL